jgi:hypothetical protein
MGSGFDQLNNPNSAELLDNGHILIADENNNRVIEVTRNKQIVWQYPNPVDPSLLNGAAFASRLPNGNTLITDSNNNRIIEVTPSGGVVFTFVTNARPGTNANPLPTRAVRLRNGNTLISDQFNDQVIAVDPSGNIVWSQGAIDQDGNGFNQLNAPYDAKVVGDYTGLTPPHGPKGEDQGEEDDGGRGITARGCSYAAPRLVSDVLPVVWGSDFSNQKGGCPGADGELQPRSGLVAGRSSPGPGFLL